MDERHESDRSAGILVRVTRARQIKVFVAATLAALVLQGGLPRDVLWSGASPRWYGHWEESE